MHKQGLTPDDAPVYPVCGTSILSSPDTEYCTWNTWFESGPPWCGVVWGRLAPCAAVGYRRYPRQSGQLAD